MLTAAAPPPPRLRQRVRPARRVRPRLAREQLLVQPVEQGLAVRRGGAQEVGEVGVGVDRLVRGVTRASRHVVVLLSCLSARLVVQVALLVRSKRRFELVYE